MSRHSIHDTEPAARWEDAFLSGNGEYGIMAFGGPGQERTVFNHHRYVLPNGTRELRPPEVSDRLEEIRDLILAGRSDEAARRWSQGGPLLWTQSFHPGHALDLRVAARGAVRDYRRTTDFTTGEITVRWSDDAGDWQRRSFVSRADAVVVQELTGPDADLRLELTGDLPGRPREVGYRTWWQAPPGGAAVLGIRGTYPAGQGAYGFEGVTLVHPEGVQLVSLEDELVVPQARRTLLLTKLDRYDTPGWGTSALTAALTALPADYETLLARHAALHSTMYHRVSLDLGAAEDATDAPVDVLTAAQAESRGALYAPLLERLFHSGRHLLISAGGVLPPRLTGLWLGAWGAAWAGDFTTDANLNLALSGANLGALPEVTAAHAALVRGQIADWRDNARALYGARGLLAPSRTDGEHGHLFHLHDEWPWPAWLAGADWLLHPLYEHWQVTGDEDFLRTELAPWLAEAALFFEDFLTRSDDSGNVVFVPSYSPENTPASAAGAAAVNAVMDVAAGRHALETAVEVCSLLGVEPEGVERWRKLLSRIPPYLVDEAGALAEWAWPGLGGSQDHRHISHLYPVWPLRQITPEDTPALADAARRALTVRGDENLSAHGSLHRALAHIRLRDGAAAASELLKILGNDMFFRSLMSSHNPGLDIYNADAALAIPGVLLEMLADSVPGALRLLPALPAELGRGSARGITCRGGVTVEALRWDRDAGNGTAALRSAVAQQLAVHGPGSRGEPPCRIALAAGLRVTVEFAFDGTVRAVLDPAAGASS
ncbi:glycosyl hydrolase family 95 catalytic domain-containing protein [Streptomyces sp. NPDC096311]|uniref:glycosyl hydrolase family 95 catalytic domain-containing protein n=1 Tax=Streptomyces sp. NPDC096311 TaxID=3366083 RepID=UPI0037F31687